MSDTGLYSHWYERIKGIAELVDDALIELRSTGDVRKASDRLGTLLTAQDSSATLMRQVLSVILRDAKIDFNVEVLGRDLAQQVRNAELVNRLETLADVLERERSTTIEQMRK